MFRLRTLGTVALERDGAPLDAVAAQRKTLAILALLAAARQRGISRERMTAYLWPESDTDRARGALKQALHVVRRHLESPDALLGTSELRLNPAVIATDIDGFLAALEEGDLERAVDQYGGPFLDGFHLSGAPEFERWVETERRDLARRHATAVEQLALAAEARGDADAAVRWWHRLHAEDPLSGRATLGLMHALDAAGDRAAALRCAQAHEMLLREELESAPDPAVSALAARLREQPTAAAVPRVMDPPADAPASALGVREAFPAAAEAHHASMVVRRRWRPGAAAVAAALVALTLVALAVTTTRQRERPAPVRADASIAVLPFANPSGDSADSHLAEGFTDELIGTLQQVREARVAPRTAVTALAKRGVGPLAIADSFGVGHVLQGTMRRAGDQLEVTVRLVRAGDERVLWAESYNRAMRDVFAVQEEIAFAVAAALGVQPATGNDGRRTGRQTRDLEAYDLYLRGRHSWKRRTQAGLEQATAFYEQAVERDPAFAAAYAGLAEVYVNLSNFGYLPLDEALTRAAVAAERAIELDPTLAEAHASRGYVLASRLRFRDAEAAFRRSIALNPEYPWGHHYYTLLLLMLGRTQEAEEQNREALRTDPLSLPANSTRGIVTLCQGGSLQRAREELQRALALAPGFVLTLHYLAVVRAAEGADSDALALAERAARQGPGFTGVPGTRAYLYQRAGQVATADSILADLRAGTANPRSQANLAFALAVLGRIDEAFALLEQLSWDVPSVIELRADPLLRPLRADPRYPRLVRRMGAEAR